MKQYEGALRLLGCILADTPEEFYRFYPRKHKISKKSAYDYFNRMLGEDGGEYKRRHADYMRRYREARND
jgi:hypothetical protein